MPYTITKTELQDAYIIEPKVFGDNRGYFFESFTKKDLLPVFDGEFVQDNQSLSAVKGVIRGLHYYDKSSEQGVRYNDPAFGIDWGVDHPVLSDKDLKNPLFKDSGISFTYKRKLQ
jgi:dTDP-4-dehydrorhamnose 3,5-epimerase-like enzyme